MSRVVRPLFYFTGNNAMVFSGYKKYLRRLLIENVFRNILKQWSRRMEERKSVNCRGNYV